MLSGTTPEGLRYGVRRSSGKVAWCSLTIGCGTRDEGSFPAGTAHFTEHTIFKGTSRRSAEAISSYLDRFGGELNAYTTKEEIVIHATVLKEDLWKAASLLFELALQPTFPKEEVDTEKGVVIDEINSYKDSPAEEIYDRFEEMLFDGHPLGRSILGTSASVRRMGRKQLTDFVRANFTPDRMAFTAVADLDEKAVGRKIASLSEKFFPRSSGSANPQETVPFSPNPVFDRTVSRKDHQVNCVIGAPAPSLYEEEDRIAAVLLCNMLGGPASNSILNSILREKNGLVYGVECSYSQYRETGIAAISFGCEKENLDRCLEIIDRELRKLCSAPVSERRIRAARRQLLGQLAIGAESGENQCLSMGKALMAYGRIGDEDENARKVGAVTAQKLMETALRIFGPGRTSRLIFR